ncbi:MAG: hypothetical protein R6V01_05165, partial [Thermoplasmatota archaeon]
MSRPIPILISVLLLTSGLSLIIPMTDGAGTSPIPVASGFSGGSGTESDPYQISNVTHLQNMSSDLDAHYILVNDINASATRTWNWNGTDYMGFVPIGNDTDTETLGFQGTEFTGSLDGRGWNITGLFINRIHPDNLVWCQD